MQAPPRPELGSYPRASLPIVPFGNLRRTGGISPSAADASRAGRAGRQVGVGV